MQFHSAIAPLLALISIGTVFTYRLEKLTMKIMENGKEVDEQIYVDQKDNYEIFSVPAHGDRSALVLVNDFKRGYSIYKVADDESCYLVTLDAKTQKPTQLKKSVEAAHSKFPTSSFTVENKTFLKRGEFNLTTSMGKMAGKFCGKYDIVSAEVIDGYADLDSIAQGEQQKLVAEPKRVKRDVVFRDFHMACSQAQVENSLSTCPDQGTNLNVVCKFRSRQCVYSVNCDFGIVGHQLAATCRGDHMLSSAICCDYNCP